MIRLVRILALLSVCISIGCSKRKPAPTVTHPLPPSPLVSEAEPGKFGGRFTLALPTAPKTFNPVVVNDGASDAIVRLLYAPLVNLNWTSQEPGPGLAESWTASPDGKSFTFKLRPGVYWSDGTPLTAEDVVFTWNEIMYNRDYNRFTYDLFRAGGKNFDVTRVDDVTVKFEMAEVFAPFLEFMSGVVILPKHKLQKAARDRSFPGALGLGTRPDQVVGCGPFRVKQVVPGKSILLERNPEYWVTNKEGRRLPYFDEMLFVIGGGAGTDALLFLNGQSDAYENLRPEMLETFTAASSNAHFQVIALGAGTEREFLWFNQNTGKDLLGKSLVNPAKLKSFRNKKFRQAVSCALDREKMAQEIYQGRATPVFGLLSADNRKWNNPNIPRYGFDLQKARALLGEIGIEDRNHDGVAEDSEGNLLQITLSSNTGNPSREKAAGMIRDHLKQIGIKLDYVPVDFELLRRKVDETFEYEAALMGLGAGGIDPASQINVLKSAEPLHQWFPLQKTPSTDWEARIDALMDAQMRTLDFAKRKEAFDEVQAILAEEMPMIYTVAPLCYAAIRDTIGNVRPTVLTQYRVTWNLDDLYRK